MYCTIIVGQRKKMVFNITASTSSTEKIKYTATAGFTLAYIALTAALANTAADPGK